MDEFKVILVMNEAKMEVLKDKNKNYEEHLKIGEYLKDEAFFFKIDKTRAYEIIQTVGVKQDKVDEVYNKLIMPQKFYELVNRGIIKANDENLIVKYDSFESKDLFKKS